MKKDEDLFPVTNYLIEQQIKQLKPHPYAIIQSVGILQNYFQLQTKEQIKTIQKQLLSLYQYFKLGLFEGYMDINTKINNLLDDVANIDSSSPKKVQFRRSIARKSLAKYFRTLSHKLRISFHLIEKDWILKFSFPNQMRWANLCIRSIQNSLNDEQREIVKKEAKRFICRICEQQILANQMTQHCINCEQEAESKKRLLELNLELANICDLAYQEKRNAQVQSAIIKMKEKAKKRQLLNSKHSYRRVHTLDDNDDQEEVEKEEYQQELNKIVNIMNQIINFAEKILNTAVAEDQKQSLVMMNELVNSTEYIENQHVVDVINQTHKCLLDRLEYHKKQESLKNLQMIGNQTQTEDKIQQSKRSFTKSNSISFRMPKFQHSASPSQRIATDPICEEEISPLSSTSPLVKTQQKIQVARKPFKMNSSIFKISDGGSESSKSSKQQEVRRGNQKPQYNKLKTSGFAYLEINQSTQLSIDILKGDISNIKYSQISGYPAREQTPSDTKLEQFKAQVTPLNFGHQEIISPEQIGKEPSIKEGDNSSNISSFESNKSNTATNQGIETMIKKKRQTQKQRQTFQSQDIQNMQSSQKCNHRKSRFFESQFCKSPMVAPEIEAADEIQIDKGYHSDSNLMKSSAVTQNDSAKVGIKDFDFLKPLGKGAYGWVFLVKKKGSGDLYALKIIDCAQRNLEAFLDQLKAERNIFEILNSNFVVKAYFSFVHEQYLCFVQEYMVGGDLASILKTYTALDEFYVRHYMAEIILSLEYLRQQNIVHRDLKPDNILLDSQGHLKLADFGLSEQGVNSRLKLKDSLESFKTIEIPTCVEKMNESQEYQTVFKQLKRVESILIDKPNGKKIVGTPDYIAPEIILGTSISNFSSDYWSLGVIMYELLCGIAPFNDDTVEKIFDNIVNMRLEWPKIGEDEDCISPQAYDLISQLLEPNFENRIGHKSIEEIKHHPFFKGIQWNTLLSKPGLIIPELNCEQKDTEKMQQFLKKLEKTNKDAENKKLTQQLKAQLQNLERIDLLKQRSIQESDKHLQMVKGEQTKIQRQIEQLTQFYAKLYQAYSKLQ